MLRIEHLILLPDFLLPLVRLRLLVRRGCTQETAITIDIDCINTPCSWTSTVDRYIPATLPQGNVALGLGLVFRLSVLRRHTTPIISESQAWPTSGCFVSVVVVVVVVAVAAVAAVAWMFQTSSFNNG